MRMGMLDMNPLEKPRSFAKLCQPLGLPGRDDAQGALTPRIIFLSQHTLRQFSALSPRISVFSGIFPGGSSKVALAVMTGLYQLMEAEKVVSLHALMQKVFTLWLKSNFFCETRDSSFSQNNKIQIRKRIPGP